VGRSLQDDLASDAVRILGDTTQFAITIPYTRTRGTDAVDATGIWRVTGKAEVVSTRGVEFVATAELQTTSTVFAEEGTVIVNDETWAVKSVGREMFGQRTIYCQGTKLLHRAPGSGNR
jgi:hypothetical protein